jgi:hypothetical protein
MMQNEIDKDTQFHKLSWKSQFNEYADNDESTFYGYINSLK